MGGFAFGDVTKRMSRKEAIEISNEAIYVIEREFGLHSVVPLHFPVDKKSYGDIDLLLAIDCDNELDWPVRIKELLNADSMSGSGKQKAFLSKGVQFDVKRIPPQSFDMAEMMSMHSFLGGFLTYTGKNYQVKISNEGVKQKRVYGGISEPYIDILTTDPKTLLKAVDISEEILNPYLKSNEVIDLISESNQFFLIKSMREAYDKSIKNTSGRSYSQDLIILAMDSIKQSTKTENEVKEDFFKVMYENGYNPSISDKKAEREKDFKEKYNSTMVTEWTGLTKKSLGESMKQFARKFKSKEELIDYVLENDNEKIKKDFKKMVSKKNIGYSL